MIIFPAIDIQGGRCVRLRQGDFADSTTYGEDPYEMALRWCDEGAEWLHVVDLDGARTGTSDESTSSVIGRIAASTSLSVQVGGGVRSAERVEILLAAGVKRVVIGTAASRDAGLAKSLFDSYGESIAVGVDARDGVVAVSGWQESSGERATLFVRRMESLGARRFIYTDIARDGMLRGINMVSLGEVACCVPKVPVIASGGVASTQDVIELSKLRSGTAPNVEGVIIGKALYTGDITLRDALSYAAQPMEGA